MSGFRIEMVEEGNVDRVPGLLFRVFGYTYTDAWMYEPQAILRAARSGDYFFFLALDAGGEARGIVAMRFAYPNRAVGDLGTLLTDPAIRGIGSGQILKLLIEAVTRKAVELSGTAGLRALVSTEVVVHPLTQRFVETAGFTTTGIFAGWTPAWAERQRAHQIDDGVLRGAPRVAPDAFTERRAETVSILAFYQLIAPYGVTLPRRWAPMLERMYRAAKLPVTLMDPQPLAAKTGIEHQLNLTRGLARVEVREIGPEAADAVMEAVHHYRDGMVDLIHVMVPVSKSDPNPLIDALAGAGLLYAALIPSYRDSDVVVLQYLNGFRHSLAESHLHSPLAREAFRTWTS